jgi:chromosomal replication initiation ATPase DnaA
MTPHIFAGLNQREQEHIKRVTMPNLPEFNTEVFNELTKIVCDIYSININEFRSKSRLREIVYARALVSYVLRVCYNLSLPKIGTLMMQDHATILHHVRQINNFIEIGDNKTYNTIEEMKRKLKLLKIVKNF